MKSRKPKVMEYAQMILETTGLKEIQKCRKFQ